jgi:excisionase family DNA binding protein
MNVPEAGRLLGLSRNGTYEAIRRGEIPNVKIGNRILVPRGALLRLLDDVALQTPSTRTGESE